MNFHTQIDRTNSKSPSKYQSVGVLKCHELLSKCSHKMFTRNDTFNASVSCRTNVEMSLDERMSKCSWSNLYASQLGTNSYFLASNLDGGRLEHSKSRTFGTSAMITLVTSTSRLVQKLLLKSLRWAPKLKQLGSTVTWLRITW